MEFVHSKSPELIICENYRILKKIGEGGHGLIFKAEQISTGQIVAIKIIKLQAHLDKEKQQQQLARFDRETLLCAKISHPNIVQLLDKGHSSNQEPYGVFEYIEGETLKSYLASNKSLSPQVMSVIMGQVLDALTYAHSKEVVHRDLKPQNIMITTLGAKVHAKLLDFGIGSFTHNVASIDSNHLTLEQDLLGTPTYNAPEQLRGEPPTPKSDLYAWGLITIECLTGRPVMDGRTVAEVFQQHLSASNVPIPPSIIGHDLAHLLHKILEKDTTKRLGNTQVISEEFERVNFSTLSIKSEESKNTLPNQEDHTLANDLVWSVPTGEKKQLTVLCLKINIQASEKSHLNLEVLDMIQRDQLNICKDTAIRYGGFVSGCFMNNLAIYFGYPESNGTDARRAGRAALELITEVKKRSQLLHEQQGAHVSIQIGLHTGDVLVQRNRIPEGNVPNTAFDLAHNATLDNVLASPASKKILEPYLDFKRTIKDTVIGHLENGVTYQLIGERQTEALSSSYSWSTNKKMIDRDLEKARILEVWKQVSRKKEGNYLIINGQAGIGKSTLIDEIKRDIRSTDSLVRACHCLPENQNNALQPFILMFQKEWELIEGQKDAISKLENILSNVGCSVKESLPIICSWFSIVLPEEYITNSALPKEQKKLLFETLKKCLTSSNIESPTLLVIEDLQWIDPTSIEFIQYLLSDIGKSNLFLLMSSRPSIKNHWGLKVEDQINLESLSKSAIKRLIKGVLNVELISDHVLDYISKRADGIPFFAEELSYMLVEKKYVEIQNGIFSLIKDINTKSIPTTLQDLLNSRLDQLSFAKETLQLASVIGRTFNNGLLIEASQKDKVTIQNDIEDLINANLIIRQRRVQGENYIFRHALIRDAAYNNMTSQLRKEAHTKIADKLYSRFNNKKKTDLQQIAHHFQKAIKFKKASEFYQKAAEFELLKKQGHEESLNLTNQALALIVELKETKSADYNSTQEANVRIHKAAVLTNKYGWEHPDIIKNYRLVESTLETNESTKKLEFDVAKGFWIFQCTKGNIKEMHSFANKMLRLGKELNNPSYIAQAYDCLGQTQFFLGDFEGCISSAKNCYKVYDLEQERIKLPADGLDPYVICKTFESLALLFLGELDQAVHIMTQTLIETQNNNKPNLTMGLFAQRSRLELYISSFLKKCNTEKIELRQIHESTLDFNKKENFTYWEDAVNLNFTSANAISGNPLHLEKYKKTRLKWPTNTPSGAYYALIEVVAYINDHNFEKALDTVNQSILFANENEIYFALPYAYCLKAKALAGTGNLKEATQYFTKAIELSKSQKAKWTELFVTIENQQFRTDYSIDEPKQQFFNIFNHTIFQRQQYKSTLINKLKAIKSYKTQTKI